MNDSQGDNNNNSENAQREKSPAFQFYPKDVLSDGNAMAMPAEAFGIYMRLLCYDWVDNGLCDDEKVWMRLGGYEHFTFSGDERGSDDWEIILSYLRPQFIPHPSRAGFVTNRRLLKERANQTKRSEEAQKSANKRWAKVKDATASSSHGVGISELDANRCSSSSSSSSDQIQIPTFFKKTWEEVPEEATPLAQALPTSKPAGRARKVKNKLINLVDMTEAELIGLGKHPSLLAPRHLTRKREELLPQDGEPDEAVVWLTQGELERLYEKWGEEKTHGSIEGMSEYFRIQPDKSAKYADHCLTLQNWEKRK